MRSRSHISFVPTMCRTPRRPYGLLVLIASCCFVLGIALSLNYNLSYTAPAAVILANTDATSTNTGINLEAPVFEPAVLTFMPPSKLQSYIEKITNSFKQDKVSFIAANLSTMHIEYYKNGEVVWQAPILTKGKDGSWWETTAGVYKIENKSERHFSSFGHVYTPWNLQFQGNFFIHGWPTYPDGNPVSSQFSGGCIRLRDTDAEALFKQVENGTPVVVFEDEYAGDDFTYKIAPPEINATNYLVGDIKSNTIITAENSSSTSPIASITTLMTALIATEYINLDKDITIPDNLTITNTTHRLQQGMTLSTYSLLPLLLKESSSEAAESLASILGKDPYVSLMNKKAKALGMSQTHFADTSGISTNNTSTPEDLFALASYLYHNRSFIYQISSLKKIDTAYTVYDFKDIRNINPVPTLATSTFVGGKAEISNFATNSIIAVYNIKIRNEIRPIVFVVLGSNDQYAAVTALHQYITKMYGDTTMTTNNETHIIETPVPSTAQEQANQP